MNGASILFAAVFAVAVLAIFVVTVIMFVSLLTGGRTRRRMPFNYPIGSPQNLDPALMTTLENGETLRRQRHLHQPLPDGSPMPVPGGAVAHQTGHHHHSGLDTGAQPGGHHDGGHHHGGLDGGMHHGGHHHGGFDAGSMGGGHHRGGFDAGGMAGGHHGGFDAGSMGGGHVGGHH